MATLAEIKANPSTYLGEGGPDEVYQMFVDAVEALIARGLGEEEAFNLVWNDGDWVPVAEAIVSGEWRPTHRVNTPYGSGVYYLCEGGLYTIGEWVLCGDPTYEWVEDRLWLNGQPAEFSAGEWELEEL